MVNAKVVFAGSVLGYSFPAKHVSHILGGKIALSATASLKLPLDQPFEHAALLLTGAAEIDGQSGISRSAVGRTPSPAVRLTRPSQLKLQHHP